MLTIHETTEGEKHFLLEVSAKATGQRLDAFLARLEVQPGLTRSMLQQLIRNGHVVVGGQERKSGYRVQTGDVIELRMPPPSPSALVPEEVEFQVLFEDEDLAVIAKPPGLVVHPACGNETGTLVHGLLFRCANLSGISGEERPGIVHRLDKDTSGVMVIAKNDRSHQDLCAQFKERRVEKIYLALVADRMGAENGRIELPIGRHPVHRKKMAVLPAGGRAAVTNWWVLEELAECSFLQIRLETGRTHQIRVHLAHLGHPVIGDPLYGGNRSSRVSAPRQCLHSYQLSFFHPATKERLTFRSEVWPDMEAILTRLRATDHGDAQR
ncbi:MAG: RluA family pseudouridine synthase [Desulfobacteraceae bacterium]|nr:RluA family pseudouridine synthase [Desulfobacteraceae bacterium]